jgi:WD40 repeat protein
MTDPQASLASDTAAHTAANTPKSSASDQLKSMKTIELSGEGGTPYVMGLSFSPDGRYLGVVERLADGSTVVDVWDVQENRRQSRIAPAINFGDYPGVTLVWSPDGQYITFGNRGRTHLIQFWNPMTGGAC